MDAGQKPHIHSVSPALERHPGGESHIPFTDADRRSDEPKVSTANISIRIAEVRMVEKV